MQCPRLVLSGGRWQDKVFHVALLSEWICIVLCKKDKTPRDKINYYLLDVVFLVLSVFMVLQMRIEHKKKIMFQTLLSIHCT